MDASERTKMNRKQERPDYRALEIVRLLQEQEQTDIAILFGSRATGAYEDGKSDIDIMLVQEDPPTSEQKKRTWETAQSLAAERYEDRTPIQVLWQTHRNFGRMRRTVNHVVASAMKEGIIVARNQDDYTGRYGDNLDSEEYEWTVTDQRIRNAESALRTFSVLHENNGDDRYLGKTVQEGLEHALKSVISAAGTRYPRSHDVGELSALANQAVPSLEFQPSIPPNVIYQYAGSDDYYDPAQPITGIDDYFERAVNDIQGLLAAARRIQETRRGRI